MPGLRFYHRSTPLACRKCAGQFDTIELSGKGKIVTFTSVHIPPESRRGQAPYLVVMVELDEGPWIMGNLNGVDPAAATLELINQRVRLQNQLHFGGKNPGDEVAPLFVPDTEVSP